MHAAHPSPQPLHGPAFVLEAQARLHRLMSRQLPRLAELGHGLLSETADPQLEGLERALRDHLAALGALRFERLVAPGLRAEPLARDEAAFRAEVAAVSDCTEATWTAVRVFTERGANHASEAAEHLADFILEVRSIQRTVTELTPAAQEMWEELRIRTERAASDVSRAALAELRRKVDQLLQRLRPMHALCETGQRVQRLAYALADEQAVCRSAQKRLAQQLGRGLLEPLRALLAPGRMAKSEALAQAQEARRQLEVELQEATRRVRAVRACLDELREALIALGGQIQAAAHGGARW